MIAFNWLQRTVRRLLAEGQATSYEKAELAAQLLTFSFDEYDSIQAAEECSSIYTALQFLQQDCELCAGKFPMGKVRFIIYLNIFTKLNRTRANLLRHSDPYSKKQFWT